MRMRTTEMFVGDTYTFRWSIWDSLNRSIYARYPRRATWFTAGDDRAYPAALPRNGATVEVVATEVAYLDRRGNHGGATNYRGRPFVLVRDASGETYVPVDPQNLYPAGEVPGARRAWLAGAGWLAALLVLFVTLSVGFAWLTGPPDGGGGIPSPLGIASLAVSAAILSFSVRWLFHQLGERRSEGTLRGALGTGLAVGAVMAIGALVRYALGWGE